MNEELSEHHEYEEMGQNMALVAAEEGSKQQARVLALFFNEFMAHAKVPKVPGGLPDAALVDTAGQLTTEWMRAVLGSEVR